jgi:single-strand DNA-binding protein
MGLATNRGWTTDQGEKKEETEFHRIVAWNKLAELCNQLCAKGRRIFVEGRLQTRQWTGQDGQQRQATEIVIEDMILLDSASNRPQPTRAVQTDQTNQVSQVSPIISVADQSTADQVADDIPF